MTATKRSKRNHAETYVLTSQFYTEINHQFRIVISVLPKRLCAYMCTINFNSVKADEEINYIFLINYHHTKQQYEQINNFTSSPIGHHNLPHSDQNCVKIIYFSYIDKNSTQIKQGLLICLFTSQNAMYLVKKSFSFHFISTQFNFLLYLLVVLSRL